MSFITRAILGIFFILLGIISATLHFSATARTEFIEFTLENSLLVLIFGISFFLIGIALLSSLFWIVSRRYYRVRSNDFAISVSEQLLNQSLIPFWASLFPNETVSSELSVHSNKIYITADLPFVPLSQREILIQQIKRDLHEHLEKLIGDQQIFYLSLRFRRNPS